MLIFDLTTTVSANTYHGIELVDTNGERIGRLECFQKTNGDYGITLGSKYGTSYPKIELNVNSQGKASCSFPNTTCCDGRWVNTYKEIFEAVSCYNSSSTSTGWYSLNGTDGLPSDSYSYECQIRVTAETDSTSGHMAVGVIQSDILGNGCVGARVRTRTNSTMIAQSTVIIPVNSNHRIRLARSSGWYGTVDATLVAYRRIGSNS